MNMGDGQYQQICELKNHGKTIFRVPHVKVGYGTDMAIQELANTIKDTIGFCGEINWDESKPDGSKQKLLDNNRLSTAGWQPKIDLETGVRTVYEWYKDQIWFIYIKKADRLSGDSILSLTSSMLI